MMSAEEVTPAAGHGGQPAGSRSALDSATAAACASARSWAEGQAHRQHRTSSASSKPRAARTATSCSRRRRSPCSAMVEGRPVAARCGLPCGERWLFPSRKSDKAPISTANSAACSMRRPSAAGIKKKVYAARVAPQLRHPPARCAVPISEPSSLLGHANSTPRPAISLPLHPPRRHLQSPAGRGRRQRRRLPWKDYRIDGPGRWKTMTLADPRVHPPLPDARAAQGLPPHPPLRPVRQRQPRRQHRTRTRAARRAAARRRARGRQRAAPDEPRVLPCPCPRCGGRMIVIEVFARGCEPRYRPTPAPTPIRIDTS